MVDRHSFNVVFHHHGLLHCYLKMPLVDIRASEGVSGRLGIPDTIVLYWELWVAIGQLSPALLASNDLQDMGYGAAFPDAHDC